MREITGLSGICLVVYGSHQLFGPWADVVLGCFLLYESLSMKKTGETNAT